MARFEYVLAQALKLDPLEQVKLISTLAHKVEQEIRLGSTGSESAPSPLIMGSDAGQFTGSDEGH